MDEETNTKFRLVGRVLDDNQQPIADANVRLVPGPVNTTTDQEGAFTFESLPSDRYTLSATKDNCYTPPLQVGPEDALTPVILNTRLGTTLIVRVFANRKPVEGAKLRVAGGYAATTDANGTAIVPGLAPRSYRAQLTADGFADENLMFSVQEDPGGVLEHDFTLRRGAPIEGVVLDAQGAPISDAWVCLAREADGALKYEAWTENDGKWRVVALGGKYRLMAQSRDHGQNPHNFVEVDGHAARSGIEIRLGSSTAKRALTNLVSAARRFATSEKPTLIAGFVVDNSGHPIAGASVSVAEPEQEGRSVQFSRWKGETDSRGFFEADGLNAPEYEVTAAWPRIEWPHGKLAARQRMKTGETSGHLVLPPGGDISGRVLLDGAPVPYFGIAVTTPNVLGGLPVGLRTAEGRFTLRHITPGPWQVVIMAPGTRRKVIDSITVEDGGTLELGDIELEHGQRIDGTVRDLAGATVVGARVSIGHWSRIAVDQKQQLQRWFHGYFEVLTDSTGRYVFDGVDAHTMPRPPHIWVEHHSAGSSLVRELAATDSHVDFTLLGAGDIDGVLQGMRGGIPMALAVRDDEPHAARMAPIQRDGVFRFEALPPGDYTIKLTVPDAEPVTDAKITVKDGETTIATLVMNTTSVELVVVVPSGRGKELVIEPTSPGAKVGDNMRRIMRMGTVDRCTLHHVRPGEYRISLDGETWTPITVTASPEKQTVSLDQ